MVYLRLPFARLGSVNGLARSSDCLLRSKSQKLGLGARTMTRGVSTYEELLQSEPTDDPDDVEFASKFGARQIILNRPKKLNSLNGSMSRKILPRLKEWEKSDMTNVVLIKGSGRAFCAGGDVNALSRLVQEGPEGQTKALDYFSLEYNLDYTIATYKKPYIALMDGITMGGGVGLSIHAPFRIATESTVFAMPETTIGFFPDVGASFFLPRLDGNIGTYLGLTSAQVRGVDNLYHGLATHFVHSTSLPALEKRLGELVFLDEMSYSQRLGVVNATIEEFTTDLPSPTPEIHGALRVAIDQTFSPNNSIGEILGSLRQIQSAKNLPAKLKEWAKKTADTLEERSPISVAVTLEMMKRAQGWSIAQAFTNEHAIAGGFMKHPDFVEGVTARLVDKKAGRPDWKPAQLGDVTKEDVDAFFNEPASLEIFGASPDQDYKESPYRQYALPAESEIVDFQQKTNGSAKSVAEHFSKIQGGKVGVREKVAEVLNRYEKLGSNSSQKL